MLPWTFVSCVWTSVLHFLASRGQRGASAVILQSPSLGPQLAYSPASLEHQRSSCLYLPALGLQVHATMLCFGGWYLFCYCCCFSLTLSWGSNSGPCATRTLPIELSVIVHLITFVLMTIKLYLTALVSYDLTLFISLSHIASHFYVFLGEMVIQFLCIFKDVVAIYG